MLLFCLQAIGKLMLISIWVTMKWPLENADERPIERWAWVDIIYRDFIFDCISKEGAVSKARWRKIVLGALGFRTLYGRVRASCL